LEETPKNKFQIPTFIAIGIWNLFFGILKV